MFNISVSMDEIAKALPSLLWLLFAIIAFCIFRKSIMELVNVLVWRVRTGSQVKIASFEIGASQYYVSPNESGIKKSHLIKIREDTDHYREHEREQYYEPNRRIFMVHRIATSKKPNELYDIFIYLLPHKDATLSNVQFVDYYFGKYWKYRIFTSADRANGFPISTSAFGPFVCTAELHFTDGKSCIIMRYIDFEMGSVGNVPITRSDK